MTTPAQEVRRRFMAALEAGLTQAEAVEIANGQASMPKPNAPAPAAPAELVEKIKTMSADDLSALRSRYTELAGKKPYGGWDADTLKARIAAAEANAA